MLYDPSFDRIFYAECLRADGWSSSTVTDLSLSPHAFDRTGSGCKDRPLQSLVGGKTSVLDPNLLQRRPLISTALAVFDWKGAATFCQ